MPETPQQFTIPAPDGVTITDNAGVWSAVVPASSGNPVSFNNGILTVNGVEVDNLTLQSLTLDTPSAPALADGEYLWSVVGGKASFTPYVPPASSGGASAGTDYAVAAASMTAYGEQFIKVPGAILAKGQAVTVIENIAANPTLTSNTFHPSVYVNARVFADPAGQVWLYLGNGNGSAYGASSWTVTVR